MTQQASKEEMSKMPIVKYKRWITAEGQARLRALVREGKTDREIANAIGVYPHILSKWRNKYPEIADALKRYTDTETNQAIDRHDLIKAQHKNRLLSNIETLKRRIMEWETTRKADDKPLTLSSLCLFLGVTKQALQKHLNNDLVESHALTIDPITGEQCKESVHTVLNLAKLRIESDLEDRMITGTGSTQGIMFDLKNHHGYVDRQTVESEIKPIKKDDKTDDERIEELLARRDGGNLKLVQQQ